MVKSIFNSPRILIRKRWRYKSSFFYYPRIYKTLQNVYNVNEKEEPVMSSIPTQIRIDSKVKEQAIAIFSNLGLDMSSAVNIFLRQCVIHGGLPFAVEIPNYNEKVLAAMEEAVAISNDDSVEGFDNIDDLKKALTSD